MTTIIVWSNPYNFNTIRWRSIVMTNNHETIHVGLSCGIILVGGGGYD